MSTTPPSSPLKNAMKGISDMLGAGTKARNLLTAKITSAGPSETSGRVTRIGSGALSRSTAFGRPLELISVDRSDSASTQSTGLSAEDRSRDAKEKESQEEASSLSITVEDKLTLAELKLAETTTTMEAMITRGQLMQEQLAEQAKQIEKLLARPVAKKSTCGGRTIDRRKSGGEIAKGAKLTSSSTVLSNVSEVETASGAPFELGETEEEQEEDAASINSTKKDNNLAAVERAMAIKSAEDRRAAGGKPSPSFLLPTSLHVSGYPPGKVDADFGKPRKSDLTVNRPVKPAYIIGQSVNYVGGGCRYRELGSGGPHRLPPQFLLHYCGQFQARGSSERTRLAR